MITKKIRWTFIIICIGIATLCAQEERESIAVLELDPTGISNTDAQFLSDRLRNELFQTGVFTVVERQKMDQILSEQGFQQSGCTSVECAVEIGQILNVSGMVAGSIGKIEDVYSINLRLIDVTLGVIARTATRDYSGKLSDMLTSVIPEVAGILAGKNTIKKPVTQTPVKKVEIEKQVQDYPPIILVKFGPAFLQYVSDLNKTVKNFNNGKPKNFNIDNLNEHAVIALEYQFALSEKWHFKAGIAIEKMLDNFYLHFEDFDNIVGHFYDKIEMERNNTFTNVYAGVNHLFFNNSHGFTLYSGFDLGVFVTQSLIKEKYDKSGEHHEFEQNRHHNNFMMKLCFGTMYSIKSSFVIGGEIVAQISKAVNLADDKSQYEFFPVELQPILYPDNYAVSGLQLNVSLGYVF